jgi:hypothetical protein
MSRTRMALDRSLITQIYSNLLKAVSLRSQKGHVISRSGFLLGVIMEVIEYWTVGYSLKSS